MAGFAAGGHGSGMQKQLVGRLYVRLVHCLATMVPKIDQFFRSTCFVYYCISNMINSSQTPLYHQPCEDSDFLCEECISGSMRYITSSYMATAFGSRPPWSSLHGLGEDSTASLNIRVLRPKIE